MKIIPTSISRVLATAAAGLLLASASAFAQGVSQDTPFPAVPDETIKLGDDREIHVYKATVISARGNRLTVRFDHGERFTYDVPPEYRFEIDGRKVRTRDLNRGDELTAYVTVSQTADHQLVQVEESAGTTSIVATTMPEPVADMLPSTASPIPLIGLLGALSLGLGGLGFAVRRRLS